MAESVQRLDDSFKIHIIAIGTVFQNVFPMKDRRHMSVAGAQLADCPLDEAVAKVKLVLRDMTEKGEI